MIKNRKKYIKPLIIEIWMKILAEVSKGPVTKSQIYKRTTFSFASIHHNIENLERLNLVNKTKSGRCHIITLTKKGRELANHVMKIIELSKEK